MQKSPNTSELPGYYDVSKLGRRWNRHPPWRGRYKRSLRDHRR